MDRQTFIDAAARTLFVDAWASYMEEFHPDACNWSGLDLFDLAPVDNDPAMVRLAERFADEFIAANPKRQDPYFGEPIAQLYKACEGICQPGTEPEFRAWVNGVTMTSLDHGVCWWDHAKIIPGYNAKTIISIPHTCEHEGGYLALERDYDADGNPIEPSESDESDDG